MLENKENIDRAQSERLAAFEQSLNDTVLKVSSYPVAEGDTNLGVNSAGIHETVKSLASKREFLHVYLSRLYPEFHREDCTFARVYSTESGLVLCTDNYIQCFDLTGKTVRRMRETVDQMKVLPNLLNRNNVTDSITVLDREMKELAERREMEYASMCDMKASFLRFVEDLKEPFRMATLKVKHTVDSRSVAIDKEIKKGIDEGLKKVEHERNSRIAEMNKTCKHVYGRCRSSYFWQHI